MVGGYGMDGEPSSKGAWESEDVEEEGEDGR